jgi:glycerol uptake facilitator-like aquaporin
MVAGRIGAAYSFTASTSFANPSIAIVRALSDTFSGIRSVGVPGFIGAQLVGVLAGLWVARGLFLLPRTSSMPVPELSLVQK